jgi:hypothetical protein
MRWGAGLSRAPPNFKHCLNPLLLGNGRHWSDPFRRHGKKNREVASLRLQKIVVVGTTGMPERMVIADLKQRYRYEIR